MKVSKYAASLGIEPGADTAAAEPVVDEKDIVVTVKTAGTFGAFLRAIHRTALAETLKGAGPFTVFTPSNDAFAQIPKEQLEALLADKTKLTRVLSRHVVAELLPAAELKTDELETLGGDRLAIELVGDEVRVGVAKVISSDIAASNGVIHVIDCVLLTK